MAVFANPPLPPLNGPLWVVCGGTDGSNFLDLCISWAAGNTSWTPLYTMRCLPIIRDKPSCLVIRFTRFSNSKYAI